MNWLAENALLIWVGAAVALTLAVVIYSQVRTLGALLGIVGVVAVAAGLLLAEHFLETPREAVSRTLYELADAVEANDVARTLAHIVPASNAMRTDVETLMPRVRIEKANIIGTPMIDVDMARDPPEARVECRGFVQATEKQGGMKGGDMAELVITFVRDGERWLVKDYTTSRDWRRGIGR
jgi:hypothetical protein